ncbi:MAG: P-loop NTPase fold protein [Leptospiraceae bacterium]|nr:P-loop NTPase fold protein [Leptospiraceae bacterium]MDW7976526.1 P-loop NTPase fold protein [Leptospiraceae bacterium]
MPTETKDQILDLVDRTLSGHKFSIAKLISLFENTKPELIEIKNQIIDYLKQKSSHRGFFVGITGTPGVGKSTLTGKLALKVLEVSSESKVAILAIDPSSEISGGALLGDRTRVRLPIYEERIYFRSQANDRELGGLSKHTFSVSRVLFYLFDWIFIETVGIGQSEIEIQHIADTILLVLQPLTGDQIQFMKAGIMEIPNAFVINKWDQEKEAKKTYYTLKSTLSFVRPEMEKLPIFRVSAQKGLGLEEVLEYLIEEKSKKTNFRLEEKEAYYFEKWVRTQYGLKGLEILKNFGGASLFIKETGSFDLALQKFSKIEYVIQYP